MGYIVGFLVNWNAMHSFLSSHLRGEKGDGFSCG